MMIPKELEGNCYKSPGRKLWLENLTSIVEDLKERWSLSLAPPFEHATCSWVAPAVRSDGSPAVLKVGMPHMESEDEIAGLRFWNGNPTVRLLEADEETGAMLLEQCLPGSMLRSEPEHKQDEVIASLAIRARQAPGMSEAAHRFRHLSVMIDFRQEETLSQAQSWPDAGLVREGLQVVQNLARPSAADGLLLTDLHAGNVLRSHREPWIAIDPKPFIGDPTYDLVQHLINCEARLHANPFGLIERVADLAGVDPERLRLWTFARAAAEPREDWGNALWMDVARALASSRH